MPPSTSTRREWITASALILFISGLSYLLLAPHLGFQGDDWYLAFAGSGGGATGVGATGVGATGVGATVVAKFADVFAGDRPFRALFVGPVFSLLGLHATWYNYLSFALRAAGALGFFWLLRGIWPSLGRWNVLLAALFAVYPGWTDQPAPFDYQSHLLAFALQVFSLGLAVRAPRAGSSLRRAALVAGAVGLELLALLLMEYYIGMEGLRVALLFILAGPAAAPAGSFWKDLFTRARGVARAAWPYLLAAAGFLAWRVFFFNNTRAATDVGGMFGSLAGNPLMRGLWSLVYLVQDFFNVTLLAWFVPLSQQVMDLRLRDALFAIALGLVSAGVAWAALAWLRPVVNQHPPAPLPGEPSPAAMFWVGCAGVLCALAPVVLGSRHVIFPTFSRFTLPASPGAILALGGLLAYGGRERLRGVAAVTLIGLAVAANYGNAVHFADAWEDLREYWWQVSWRAPQIAPQTVVVAEYNTLVVAEDYLVWGPANLIYYPTGTRAKGLLRAQLGSVVLTPGILQGISAGLGLPDRERRGISTPQDLARVLVTSMPGDSACVHVLDGRAPELSTADRDRIFRIAPASRLDLVLADAAPQTPPAALFGREPLHGWCYSYEKASLARQRGDWAEVVRLGDEAIAAGLHPVDRVEWIPFVEGYAYLGRAESVVRLAPILLDDPGVRALTADLFARDPLGYAAQFPEGQALLRSIFK